MAFPQTICEKKMSTNRNIECTHHIGLHHSTVTVYFYFTAAVVKTGWVFKTFLLWWQLSLVLDSRLVNSLQCAVTSLRYAEGCIWAIVPVCCSLVCGFNISMISGFDRPKVDLIGPKGQYVSNEQWKSLWFVSGIAYSQ